MSIKVKDVIAVSPNTPFAGIVAAMKRFSVGAVTVIDVGVVRISGRTRWRSQAIAVTAVVRAVEGVVDVVDEVAFDEDDLVIVPSLM